MFAKRKYEELTYSKNHKMCDPIIINPVVKMRPHPAASHKEVPPPPSPKVVRMVAFGIRNTDQGIRNPTNDWNPDPSSSDKEA